MSTTATIEIRDSISDPYVPLSDVEVDNVTFAVAPELDSCQLSLDYGVIVDTGDAGAVRKVDPLDLRGKLVRITITDDDENDVIWHGYIPAQVDNVEATSDFSQPPAQNATLPFTGLVHSGRTVFHAYGMGYFLRQQTLRQAWILDSSQSIDEIVDRVPTFNANSRSRNNEVLGNRSSAKTDGIYKFDADGTDTWSALDAVEHVLKMFEYEYGISYTLTGQHAALANTEDVWSLEGATFFSALTTLINPQRGFTFFFDDTTINVISISDVDIEDSFSSILVPQNLNVTTLTLNTSSRLKSAVVTHLEQVHYDKIICRGEPLRTCFTVSVGNGLVKGWTNAEQTAYDSLSEEEQKRESNSHIYTRLEIDPTWDFNNAGGNNVIPGVRLTFADHDVAVKQKLWRNDLLFDRTLPILDDNTRQPRRPLVLVKNPSNNKYIQVDNAEDALEKSSVRVLDDRMGIRLDPKYPHVFGLNAYTGSGKLPIYDYTTVLATVSLYTDERIAYEVDALEPEPGNIDKIKEIDVPGIHYWHVAPGTVIDAYGTTTVEHPGGVVRDDTFVLRAIAELAKAWYGRRRSKISLGYNEAPIIDRLGHVVSEANYGGSVIPAGTVISRISYSLESQETSLSTEFFDIDVARLRRNRGGGSALRRRSESIDSDITNIPVRTAVPGGGGSTVVWVQIKSGGPGQDYLVDVFADGLDQPATGTDRPFKAAKIHASSTIPVGTAMLCNVINGIYWGQPPTWL